MFKVKLGKFSRISRNINSSSKRLFSYLCSAEGLQKKYSEVLVATSLAFIQFPVSAFNGVVSIAKQDKQILITSCASSAIHY